MSNLRDILQSLESLQNLISNDLDYFTRSQNTRTTEKLTFYLESLQFCHNQLLKFTNEQVNVKKELIARLQKQDIDLCKMATICALYGIHDLPRLMDGNSLQQLEEMARNAKENRTLNLPIAFANKRGLNIAIDLLNMVQTEQQEHGSKLLELIKPRLKKSI